MINAQTVRIYNVDKDDCCLLKEGMHYTSQTEGINLIDWNILSSAATAFGAVVTGIGVIFGAWQIRLGKKQAQAVFEDSLDQQYRAISMELPVNVLVITIIALNLKKYMMKLLVIVLSHI